MGEWIVGLSSECFETPFPRDEEGLCRWIEIKLELSLLPPPQHPIWLYLHPVNPIITLIPSINLPARDIGQHAHIHPQHPKPDDRGLEEFPNTTRGSREHPRRLETRIGETLDVRSEDGRFLGTRMSIVPWDFLVLVDDGTAVLELAVDQYAS